jgi:hypothetical protein
MLNIATLITPFGYIKRELDDSLAQNLGKPRGRLGLEQVEVAQIEGKRFPDIGHARCTRSGNAGGGVAAAGISLSDNSARLLRFCPRTECLDY